MRLLRKYVDAEFEQIERVLTEFPQNRLYTDLSTLELAGVSTSCTIFTTVLKIS